MRDAVSDCRLMVHLLRSAAPENYRCAKNPAAVGHAHFHLVRRCQVRVKHFTNATHRLRV